MFNTTKRGLLVFLFGILCVCSYGQQEVYALIFKPLTTIEHPDLQAEMDQLSTRLANAQIQVHGSEEIRVKCTDLEALSAELEALNLEGLVLGLVSGKILGKVYPDDLDAFKKRWHMSVQKAYFKQHFPQEYKARLQSDKSVEK